MAEANRVRPPSLLSILGMPRPESVIPQLGLPPYQAEELLPSDPLLLNQVLDITPDARPSSPLETLGLDGVDLLKGDDETTDSKRRKDASTILSSSRETQEELAAQLAAMSRQLKLNALHLSSSLAKEQDALTNATEKLDNNLQVMTKERVRLRDHSGKSSSTTWLIFGAIISVVIAWVLLFFVIRLT